MTYDTGKSDHATRRQRLWPLVLALWTTAGVSPCALAAATQLECPHCPSDVTETGAHPAGHGQHGGHVGKAPAETGHDADHGGCDGNCDDEAESLVDSRGGKSASKDSVQTIAVAGPPAAPAISHTPNAESDVDPPPAGPPPTIRLHRLYCVYRD